MRFLGNLVHDPNLWHINRQSVTRGFFIGVFCCFLPLPGQMAIAAALAIMCRANLPLSVVLVWISNPLTMGPIFFAGYQVGAMLLQTPTVNFEFELSWRWITESAQSIWLPLFLGCLICGLFFGFVTSLVIHWLWRWKVVRRWEDRRQARAKQAS